MNNNVSVLYHDNCADGFTAAYLARVYLMGKADRLECFPMNYGQELPNMAGNKIYILDFSFPKETMLELHSKYGEDNVILLDHHKTALENLGGLKNCHLDMHESGASLAYRHFFSETDKLPPLVAYVKDRDLWQWQLDNSREISAYISSFAFNFFNWDNLYIELQEDTTGAIHAGSAILRLQNKQVNKLCDNHIEVDVGDYQVAAVNSPLLQSEIGEELLRRHSAYPFAAVYYDDHESRKWSLRSRPDFDVSEVAQQFGGGGHRQAAGFTTAHAQ